MLIASALYALHIPINQRVLFDMPAQTVTMYTLLAMSFVVVPAYLLSGAQFYPQDNQAWVPIIALTMVTFFSRITLFMGVKHIGGMQTALLGLSELLVTLVFAHAWLGESLSVQQWIGATLLVINLLMVVIDKSPPRKHTNGGWFAWINPPSLSSDWPWQPHD
jgi:drug/metabolite transporter (DMT)-like permease